MQVLMNIISSSRNIAVITSVSVLGAAVGYYMWRSHKLKITGDFHHVGKIQKMFIYPIKSLPGLEVDSAYLTETGMSYGPFRDRSFLLYKEESGMMITLRQEPALACLKLSHYEDSLCIDGAQMNTLIISLKKSVDTADVIRTCRVYGQDIKGIDCGETVALWFQEYLRKPGFRLMQFVPDFKPRQIINNLLTIFKPGQMLYHDDCTYHLLSDASITDLNSRMQEKISHKNFRPNILITDCAPYAEDNMKFAKVGEATLLFMTQCPRCILTTVNPETGIKTEKEPLTTLRTYRLATSDALKKQYGKSPLFGVYMGVRNGGKVCVGDAVTAIPF